MLQAIFTKEKMLVSNEKSRPFGRDFVFYRGRGSEEFELLTRGIGLKGLAGIEDLHV